MEVIERTNTEIIAHELQGYELQFYVLLENAKIFSFATDSSFTVLVMNNYMLERTCRTVEEVIGCNWLEMFLSEEDRQKALHFYYTQENGDFESEVITKDPEDPNLRIRWYTQNSKKIKGKLFVGERVSSTVPISPMIKRKREFIGSLDNNNVALPETLGNYVIIKPLGKDNNVKLAVHRSTQDQVAIKYLPKSFMTEPEKQRALREIVILKQLNSSENPRIVKLIDSLETDTHLLLIQEYVSGGELMTFVQKNDGLPEMLSLRLFRQILCAIECCHRNKIIHRDIKLQNILLDENNNIKLIDFGVSNWMEDGIFRKTFCGTLFTASPEMLLGEEYYGPEVDLWSLGVVLYFMLTCKYPFPNIGAILKGKFHEPENLSLACLDLLRSTLTVDKQARITLEGVINHSWVKSFQLQDDTKWISDTPDMKKRRISDPVY